MSKNKIKTLQEHMPSDFVLGEFDDTIAYTMRDVAVVKAHDRMIDCESYKSWPGKHKNVHFWVELENDCMVGWNENPNVGWSFPVMKNSND